MTAEEINAARRSLTAYRGEFQRFTGWAGNAGRAAAKSFGKNFKSIAVFTLTELARGALPAIGARIVENWGKTGTKTGKTFGKSAKKAAVEELKSLTSKSGGMSMDLKNFLKITGATALGAMIYQQVKSSFDAAIEQERITISLDALSLDGGGGSRIFEALRGDALRTGIDVSSQAGIVQKMMAQGIDESGALALNRAMLDIAGGTGLTTSEVELLGTALSQIKGKGVAAMEELRGQIAEKGVPIFEALRQRFSAETVADVFDMISAGKVTADDVLETFKNLEGPFSRFLGASDRLGKTGGGLINRLMQEAEDLKRVFAAEVMPELKPALEYAIGLIQRMKAGAAEFGKDLATALGYVQAAFESLSLGEMLKLAGLQLKVALMEAMDVAQRGIAALFEAMRDDTFGTMLERSALRFKEIMLQGAAEIAEAMAAGAGGKTKIALENAANFARASADVALAQREDLEAQGKKGGISFIGRMREAFRNAPGVFGIADEQRKIREYLQRIEARRATNVAGRQESGSVIPAAAGGGGTFAAGTAANGGILGGGIANALSRITGGSTLLLERQLDALERVEKATKDTAKAGQETVAAVNRLNRTNPVFT